MSNGKTGYAQRLRRRDRSILPRKTSRLNGILAIFGPHFRQMQLFTCVFFFLGLQHHTVHVYILKYIKCHFWVDHIYCFNLCGLHGGSNFQHFSGQKINPRKHFSIGNILSRILGEELRLGQLEIGSAQDISPLHEATITIMKESQSNSRLSQSNLTHHLKLQNGQTQRYGEPFET